MATGIVSTGTATEGFSAVATVLLAVCVGTFFLLLIATVWRLVRFTSRVWADTRNPQKTFGHFTLVAALNVIGLAIAPNHPGVTLVLAAASTPVWLLLIYGIFGYLMVGRRSGSTLKSVDGSWFLCVVATQSLSASAATLGRSFPVLAAPLGSVAIALWAVGVGLYLVLAGLVTLRLLDDPVSAKSLDPSYWIFMGATGSTVLAAARILSLPGHVPVLGITRHAVSGGSFLLWAVGTWWVPLLIGLGVWRYLLKRQPVTYGTGLWSVVFPLGMYAVASANFGRVGGLAFMEHMATVVVWVALAAWVAVTGLLVWSLRPGLSRSRP